MSNKSIQIRRFLPPALATLGVVVVAAAWQGGGSSPQASVSQVSSTPSEEAAPASTETPHVSVNGKPVQVDRNGKASLDLPGGNNAHVEVSGDHTTVTTSSPSNDFSKNQTSNLEVNVQTDSTGGKTHSTARVSNSTTDHGSSRSSTSTHVFSTDSAHIDVNTR